MPELYQPADRRSLARVRVVVVGLVVVGLATYLGSVVGGQVVAATPPTKAEVRAAAHSLVPPGYSVTAEKLNVYEGTGAWFGQSSYAVELGVEGGRTPDDRLSAVRQQATKEGWRIEEEPGVASFLRFVRPEILASVSVSEVSRIGAFRLKEPPLGPFFAWAGIGALVGLAIAIIGGFLVLRRRT